MSCDEWISSMTDEQREAFERLKKKEIKKEKSVDKTKNSGIIKMRGDKVLEYEVIGNINPQLLETEFGKLQTSETIITNERKNHILLRHNEDYSLFKKYAKEIIENPEIVIKDEKSFGTVFMVKRLPSSNLNIVLRLALNSDNSGLKNSIMTAYRIRNKNLRKMEKKNKILYKKE